MLRKYGNTIQDEDGNRAFVSEDKMHELNARERENNREEWIARRAEQILNSPIELSDVVHDQISGEAGDEPTDYITLLVALISERAKFGAVLENDIKIYERGVEGAVAKARREYERKFP